MLDGNAEFWVDTYLGVGPLFISKGKWGNVWCEGANGWLVGAKADPCPGIAGWFHWGGFGLFITEDEFAPDTGYRTPPIGGSCPFPLGTEGWNIGGLGNSAGLDSEGCWYCWGGGRGGCEAISKQKWTKIF